MKIVASLTTIPSRIGTTCKEAIDSLLDQVDHVYLSVATFYKRFQEGCEIPEVYTQEPYKSKLTIVKGEDKGPATKYLGALDHIDPNTWVFVCDDDQVYAPNLIQKLRKVAIDESCAYQNRHETFKRYGTSGGLVHGYVGILIHRTRLENLKEFPLPPCAYFVDDQWMSVYCHKNGIPIVSSGVDSYGDIFAKLHERGWELFGPDSLASLGKRDENIAEIESFFSVSFDKRNCTLSDRSINA